MFIILLTVTTHFGITSLLSFMEVLVTLRARYTGSFHTPNWPKRVQNFLYRRNRFTWLPRLDGAEPLNQLGGRVMIHEPNLRKGHISLSSGVVDDGSTSSSSPPYPRHIHSFVLLKIKRPFLQPVLITTDLLWTFPFFLTRSGSVIY